MVGEVESMAAGVYSTWVFSSREEGTTMVKVRVGKKTVYTRRRKGTQRKLELVVRRSKNSGRKR